MATQKDVVRECLFAVNETPWRVQNNGDYISIVAANGSIVRSYNQYDLKHAKAICRAANRMMPPRPATPSTNIPVFSK